MSTAGTSLLVEIYPELRIGQGAFDVDGGAFGDHNDDDDDDDDEGVAVDGGEGGKGGAEQEAASEVVPVVENEDKEEDDEPLMKQSELKAAAGDEEWPDDDWVPPHPGYMVCALCRCKSGKQGRWGSGKALHPSSIRYPLSICAPCRRQHVPASEAAPPADLPPSSSEADGSAAQGVWLNGTLRLESMGAYWDMTVVQLVHPTFGQIGH